MRSEHWHFIHLDRENCSKLLIIYFNILKDWQNMTNFENNIFEYIALLLLSFLFLKFYL